MVSAMFRMIIILFILIQNNINAERQKESADVQRGMMELLNKCFGDRLEFVITSTQLHEMFFKVAWDVGPPPLMSIDENFKSNGNKVVLLHKPTFVLASNSIESFGALLQSIKSSPWWFIDALFFIVGHSKLGCEAAAPILQQMWKMNLLSALYLCYEENKGLMLYTYNPYTNRAPHPWKEQFPVFEKAHDRWTLYSQLYSSGLEHCANLMFNKIKFLDGYKIKSVVDVDDEREPIYSTNQDLDSFLARTNNVILSLFFSYLFRAMNISVAIDYDVPGYFHNDKAVGFLPKLIDGYYDISLSRRFISMNFTSITYPSIQGGLWILTQQRKFMTPVEKILSFYSSEIIYLTAIVLFITFLFILLIYKKREFAFAAFDVLRLLLSVGLHVPFNRTAIRIYIFCVFQLIIILNATFQGNISAFLTKPQRKYVDSVEDLQKYQYTIYAPTAIQDHMNKVMPEIKNINYVPAPVCSDYVINDPFAACIGIPIRLFKTAFNHELHISQSQIFKEYITFWCREDWPIKNKFDRYTSHFIEAGLFEYWREHHENVILQKLRSREEVETAAQYRPIELDDLLFAFRFLAIGLGISILVFAIEIFPWRKFLRKMKKMRNKIIESWAVLKLIWRR